MNKKADAGFFGILLENIQMALEALSANKLRSILTTLGIIIGVATVIAMIAIVNGINNIVDQELSRIGANVFFVQRFPAIQISFDWRKFQARPQISAADWEAIDQRCPTVYEVSPEVYQSSKTISFEGEKTDPDVYLVGATDSFFRVNGYNIDEGRYFTAQEIQKKHHVCVLGMTVVERLFPHQTPVGQQVRVDGKGYTVIGVFEELGTMFGTDRDNTVIVPISNVINLNAPQRHHDSDVTIAVQARHGVSVSRSMDEVRSALRVTRGLRPMEEDNFELETRDSIMGTYQSMTGKIFFAAIAIAGISLLIGGIGIMNIMLVSVRERTREIGIRKALGARGRDILWQFLVEAMSLSIAGGLLGLGLAVGGLKLAARYTDKLPMEISTAAILLAVVFSMTVGIFFGVFPARKAAALDPIESLRYE